MSRAREALIPFDRRPGSEAGMLLRHRNGCEETAAYEGVSYEDETA